MLIGITGTDGAGKGAAVSYLVNKNNFKHYSARAIWEEEFKKRGIESSRANMRLLANELRAMNGNDFLVKHYLEVMKASGEKDAVIESIRALAEVETLKKNGGFLLAIDADKKIRFNRVKGRNSSSDSITFEEFLAHEELEMDDPDPNGMQKAAVMASADYTIMNNGSISDLGRAVDNFLQKIKQ